MIDPQFLSVLSTPPRQEPGEYTAAEVAEEKTKADPSNPWSPNMARRELMQKERDGVMTSREVKVGKHMTRVWRLAR